MCHLQRKLRWGRSRRQRSKRDEKFDGWACYPLLLPILRDTIHNEYAIDELINTHDPSRIIDYGNVLRFAPRINNSWSNTPPSTNPGGTARAWSAAPCLSTTLGICSRDTFSCYGSSFKPMIPAVDQILRAQKPRWYQI